MRTTKFRPDDILSPLGRSPDRPTPLATGYGSPAGDRPARQSEAECRTVPRRVEAMLRRNGREVLALARPLPPYRPAATDEIAARCDAFVNAYGDCGRAPPGAFMTASTSSGAVSRSRRSMVEFAPLGRFEVARSAWRHCRSRNPHPVGSLDRPRSANAQAAMDDILPFSPATKATSAPISQRRSRADRKSWCVWRNLRLRLEPRPDRRRDCSPRDRLQGDLEAVNETFPPAHGRRPDHPTDSGHGSRYALASWARPRTSAACFRPPSTTPVDTIAVNAVMAGCRPEYFGGAVQSSMPIRRSTFTHQCNDHPVCPLLIASGPMVGRIGLNHANVCRAGANATIGRAIRLAMVNIARQAGRRRPGDARHPASSAIAAEDAAANRVPLSFQRGFAADEDVVTLFGAEAPTRPTIHQRQRPRRARRDRQRLRNARQQQCLFQRRRCCR